METVQHLLSNLNATLAIGKDTHTHTRLTALFRDYPGELIPER